MIAAFLTLAPWKKWIDIGICVATVAAGLWVYFALVHRAEAIRELTLANGQLSVAANDNAIAAAQSKAQLDQTTAALKLANEHAQVNATLAGQMKERISHAPKNGCVGPAERALLDGMRTDALNRRSQVPQPVSAGN